MSNTRPGCEARYEAGSYRCDKCGFIWDYEDPEPPECLTDNKQSGREALNKLHTMVDSIPDDKSLPWFLQDQQL